MKKNVLAIATLAACAMSFGVASADPLPAGPGRNVVVNKCASCHATALIENERHDADGWHEVIDKMVDRGLAISEPDRNTTVAYLVRVLGPQTKPPAPLKPPAKPVAAKAAAKPKP